MEKKNKEKQESKLREPKAKTNRFGLKVPVIRMPHEDLIKPESPRPELVPPIHPIITLPSQTSQTTHTRQSEVAPAKNFQKVANSITKQAIPDGWFKGKSKQLYDALYSLTRGAVTPTRKVRVSKSKLMKLAAIGSRITFDANVEHLTVIGLIKANVYAGEHLGNEFEVFLPEEISMPSQTSVTSLTSPAQKLDRLVILETSQTSQSINSIDTTTSDEPKTSFKTNTYDDEAFARFTENLSRAVERLTGRKPTANEAEKWGILADVLIEELEKAADNAGTISCVPAFFTEHLKRCFYSKARVGEKKTERPAHLDVGKGSVSPSHEPAETPRSLMTDEQRQNTLNALQEDKKTGGIFFREFETYGEIEYAPEDFEWLVKNLESEKLEKRNE